MIQLVPEVLQALTESLNDESHLKNLLHCLTLPPMYTTLRFDASELDGSVALDALSSCLAKCEETLRPQYDMFLHPSLSDCIIIRNRGPNDQPKISKEVIVDLACGMALLRGAHLYKQGIMAATHCLRVGDMVSVYADLDAKCLKGLAVRYQGKKLFVGNGISQVSRADLFNMNSSQSSGIGVLMTHPVYEAPSLAEVSLPWVHAQNLPSITCVYVLDPQRGDLILDMCAAPGGKTAHIASLMKDEGRVIALEKSKVRANKMENCLKSKCIEVYVYDSINAVDYSADTNGGPPYPPATFERILVDAPCSALGQRPCYVNKISANQLKSFPVIQHKLLITAVKLLKPGGVLVYSTCTITREENEDQVAKLLSKCSDMELVSTPYKLGGRGLARCALTEEQTSLVQRFDPRKTAGNDDFNVDTIGFFIAKFQKKYNSTDR